MTEDHNAPGVIWGDDDGDGVDLLSIYTNTTFYDSDSDERQNDIDDDENKLWQYTHHKQDGNVNIYFEWIYKSESVRLLVIGPDWLCACFTVILISAPIIVAYLYIIDGLGELIVFTVVSCLCLFGFIMVFTQDPGLMRIYNHARTSKWTLCDKCESFRPPKTVHCSFCNVCIAGYDVSIYYPFLKIIHTSNFNFCLVVFSIYSNKPLFFK